MGPESPGCAESDLVDELYPVAVVAHGFLMCTWCAICVWPQDLGAHFQGRKRQHLLCLSNASCQQLLRKVSALDNLATLDTWRNLRVLDDPIPEIPIVRALQCPLCEHTSLVRQVLLHQHMYRHHADSHLAAFLKTQRSIGVQARDTLLDRLFPSFIGQILFGQRFLRCIPLADQAAFAHLVTAPTLTGTGNRLQQLLGQTSRQAGLYSEPAPAASRATQPIKASGRVAKQKSPILTLRLSDQSRFAAALLPKVHQSKTNPLSMPSTSPDALPTWTAQSVSTWPTDHQMKAFSTTLPSTPPEASASLHVQSESASPRTARYMPASVFSTSPTLQSSPSTSCVANQFQTAATHLPTNKQSKPCSSTLQSSPMTALPNPTRPSGQSTLPSILPLKPCAMPSSSSSMPSAMRMLPTGRSLALQFPPMNAQNGRRTTPSSRNNLRDTAVDSSEVSFSASIQEPWIPRGMPVAQSVHMSSCPSPSKELVQRSILHNELPHYATEEERVNLTVQTLVSTLAPALRSLAQPDCRAFIGSVISFSDSMAASFSSPDWKPSQVAAFVEQVLLNFKTNPLLSSHAFPIYRHWVTCMAVFCVVASDQVSGFVASSLFRELLDIYRDAHLLKGFLTVLVGASFKAISGSTPSARAIGAEDHMVLDYYKFLGTRTAAASLWDSLTRDERFASMALLRAATAPSPAQARLTSTTPSVSSEVARRVQSAVLVDSDEIISDTELAEAAASLPV